MIYNFVFFLFFGCCYWCAPSSSPLLLSRLSARVQLNVVFSLLNCRYYSYWTAMHRFVFIVAFRCDSNAFAVHTHSQSSEWTIIWTVPFDRIICCELHKVLSNTTDQERKKRKRNNNGIIRTTTHRNEEKPMWRGKLRARERETHAAQQKKIVANQMQKIPTNLLLNIMFAAA